jgi:hypothetical protein
MPPQRSVILDAELCQGTGGEPVRVVLADSGTLLGLSDGGAADVL